MPLRTTMTVLLVAMLVANVAYLVGLAFVDGPFVDIGLSLLTQWVPVAIFWLAAAMTQFGRLDVILAALAVTVSALADSFYVFAMDSEGYLAFPSMADAGYLLFYPLMVGALVALVRSQLKGIGRIVALESAIASLGAATLLAVIVDPVIHGALGGDGVLDRAISLAYPLFDLLLLAVMAGIMAAPGINVGRRWWALATGLAIFTAADIVYALLEHNGTYLAGSPLDATWAIALAFVTWWVAGTVSPPAPRLRVRRSLDVPIPAIAVVAGLTVLVIATQVPLSMLAVVLAALTVGFAAMPIILRQAVMGRMLAAQEDIVRQLTELDHDKSAMMASMSRDLKTPVASITANVDGLLEGGDLFPNALDRVVSIQSSAVRLQTLVDNLLAMSKLQGGFALAPLSRSDLAGVLERAAASLRPLAKTKNVHFSMDLHRTALIVDADRGQLQRAFGQLIENAVKFSADRGIVRITAEDQFDGRILVEITDTGMGIPRDDIPRLFSRFFRAGNAHSAAVPGAGLGLSIAKGIIEAHGGKIDIASALGQGTTATVTLPKSTSSATTAE
jgi:signal transduction histidine kinase